MPRSKSRDRKTSSEQNSIGLSSRSPGILQLELENLALKAKNADLVRGHIKLTQENHEYKTELMDARRQLFTLQTKYNNATSSLEKLETVINKCTPSVLEIMNIILQTNKDLNLNKPVKNVTVHTVTPHIVNGTVLNLNPTITLNRMSNNEQEPRPSTSRAVFANEISTDESPNNLTINNENISPRAFTPRDRNAAVVPIKEDNEDEAETYEDEDHLANHLSAIPEETSMDKSNPSIGEIRICLKRMSPQEISRLSRNGCTASEVNVNDTCFNIEATIIEDGDERVSKTVSADISFSSPNGNSTCISNVDGLSANSKVVSRRKYTAASSTRSSSLATSTLCENTENQNRTPNLFLELPTPSLATLPTPSMSRIGDISDGSKLEFLQESKSSGSSPSPSIKKQLQVIEQDSPRSSRNTATGVNRRRRGPSESDICMSPRVLLERADSRASELSTQEEDDVKENNQVVAKSKKSKPFKQTKKSVPSKQTTKSVPLKRTKKSETLKETKKRQKTSKTTKELQVKLSNFIPEASPRRSSTESIGSNYGEGRPKRSARPSVLKDASLKTKMRRLI